MPESSTFSMSLFSGSLRSRVRATEKLIDFLARYDFNIEMVVRHPDEEVILQKDKKQNGKKLVAYTDNKETSKMRTLLHQYNEFIQQTSIDLDYIGYRHVKALRSGNPEYLAKLPKELFFDLTKKKVSRIFNNKSFTQGGRFYGGFWMELPSELRLRLILDMQKVVEADYSGVHIHLLYNQEGIDYGKDQLDPYDIPGYGSSKKHRNLFKKLLLAVINAKKDNRYTGETKAIMALQKDINYNRADFPDEIPDLHKVLEDFKNHHQPIAHYFCTGAGLKLMYQDSQIAALVMKAMMLLGIPVLPVHDSFICPKQHSELLVDVMSRAYIKVTGKKLTRTPYTVNIKEPEEWNRAEGDELFPDDNCYFDLQYTEDTELVKHMISMDGAGLYDDREEDQSLEEKKIVAPHVPYIKIPIEYKHADRAPLTGPIELMISPLGEGHPMER